MAQHEGEGERILHSHNLQLYHLRTGLSTFWCNWLNSDARTTNGREAETVSAQRGVSRKSGEPVNSGDHIMIKIKHEHSSGVRYAPGRRYARSPHTVSHPQAKTKCRRC